jgi:cobalt/nickel transport system permease protein
MKHFFLDVYSQGDSLIHRIDPRVKTFLIFSYILVTVLTPPANRLRFLFLGAFILILISLSRIPISFFLRRLLILIPFLMLLFAFLPFIPQNTISGSYNLGTKIAISKNAVMIIFNTGIKAILSLLALTLLISTTGFNNFLKVLESAKIPAIFVHTLSFMYRYIFLIQEELHKLLRAKRIKTINCPRKLEYRALSSIIGTLFLRSYERAENVYYAMLARGFSGKIRTLKTWRIKVRDLIFAGISLFSLAVIAFWMK